MADERDLFERIARALDALGEGTTRDKLDLLLLAWLSVAANARNEQLPYPDGFTAEQQRQLKQLEIVTASIREAAPDLEGERLHLEGDHEGWRRHVLDQIQQAQDPDDGTKGA